MERFVIRECDDAAEASPPRHRVLRRFTWKHALTEVSGRIDSSHKQTLLNSMLRSFSEIGSFPQTLNNQGIQSSTLEHGPFSNHFQPHFRRPHISSLTFDSKGVYLASVTNSGSLSIHDYEDVYCRAQGLNTGSVMPVMHLLVCPKLEAVTWNPFDQDEVACVAAWDGKVYCYDISWVTDRPSQVLKISPKMETVDSMGLLDLIFSKIHEKRVLACGKHGEIYVWDRRINCFPQSIFSSEQHGQLSCLALTQDEQMVYAGSSSGQLRAWDIRGGRSSTAFIAPGEVYNPPFTTWKISTLLEQIPSLRAQTAIEMSGIQSVCLNRCCEQQLAFHLNNGWSGVLDLSSLDITHIYCPPPPWFCDEGSAEAATSSATTLSRRKPTWLSANSIYACPSLSSPTIKFLDFKLGPSSPHYVEETGEKFAAGHVEMSTSEFVMTCAAHPLNDHIAAGTIGASILVFGQRGNCIYEGKHEISVA